MVSVGSGAYSPIACAASSPAFPSSQLAAQAASKGATPRAQMPASRPERTSPLPPLASAGEPVGLMATRSPSVMTERLFFRMTVTPRSAANAPLPPHGIRQHLGARLSDEASELLGVRR